jgi:hypothetical protein
LNQYNIQSQSTIFIMKKVIGGTGNMHAQSQSQHTHTHMHTHTCTHAHMHKSTTLAFISNHTLHWNSQTTNPNLPSAYLSLTLTTSP